MSEILDELTKMMSECEVNFNRHGASHQVLQSQLDVNREILQSFIKSEQRAEKLEKIVKKLESRVLS